MGGKGRRSDLWKCFEDAGDEKAKCNFCNSLISIKSGSITNMYRHLNRKHTEYANEHYKNRVDRWGSKSSRPKPMNDNKNLEDVYEKLFSDVTAEGDECDDNDNEYEMADPISIATNSRKSEIQEVNNSSGEVIYVQCIPTKQEKPTQKKTTYMKEKMFEMMEQTAVERKELMKMIRDNKKCADGDNEIDVFFRSMAMCVKKLPPSFIAEAKLEICNIVTKLELRYLHNQKNCNNSEMTQTDNFD